MRGIRRVSRVAYPVNFSRVMAIFPGPNAVVDAPFGYHCAVSSFKRRLIEAALHDAAGNRTHAARVLGLQRTYLLRLIRDLHVAAPPPPDRRRRPAM